MDLFTLSILWLPQFVYGTITIVRCPENCNCFPVRKSLAHSPPTYNKVPYVGNDTLTAVSCQRQQLTTVPKGLARDTAVLILSYNQISHLNRSMFRGLDELQLLALSHNVISSIENDTFDDMSILEQLDISFNQIRRLPRGLLCPWYRRGYGAQHEMTGCSGWITAQTQLRLTMSQNPWHCNCDIQQFVEQHSCAYEEVSCISFVADDEDPIGQCTSPLNLRGIPLRRLSSTENGRKLINVCKYRKTNVDIPLLVTIFTWMGAVLGYVIYFISWNNQDIANHRSYLHTLNVQENARQNSHAARAGSVASGHIMREFGTPSTIRTEHRFRLNGKKENHCSGNHVGHMAPPIVHVTESDDPDVWVARENDDSSEDFEKYDSQPNPKCVEVKPANHSRRSLADRGPEVLLCPSPIKSDNVMRLSSL